MGYGRRLVFVREGQENGRIRSEDAAGNEARVALSFAEAASPSRNR
jgi:hypothetical protein